MDQILLATPWIIAIAGVAILIFKNFFYPPRLMSPSDFKDDKYYKKALETIESSEQLEKIDAKIKKLESLLVRDSKNKLAQMLLEDLENQKRIFVETNKSSGQGAPLEVDIKPELSTLLEQADLIVGEPEPVHASPPDSGPSDAQFESTWHLRRPPSHHGSGSGGDGSGNPPGGNIGGEPSLRNPYKDKMAVIISVLVLIAALIIILVPAYAESRQEWAFGAVGTIIGYWVG